MNKHFSRQNDARPDVPPRAYARVDHIERDELRPETVLLGIDLIDAHWLENQGIDNPIFDLNLPPEKLVDLWHALGRSLAPNSGNPLENAPLYRLELEVTIGDTLAEILQLPPYRDPTRRQAEAVMERSWFTLELSPNLNSITPALLYAGMFAPATPVTVKGAMPSAPKIATALSAMFTLRHLPQLTTNGFARELENRPIAADYLAAYDVGQGNASALVEDLGLIVLPTLYFDLGMGVYRNAKTTPYDLRFCFSNDPMIVLSHWDADHWAGAYGSTVNGIYPALRRTWIAPLQDVGPTHIAFVYDVLSAGGSFLIYTDALGSSGSLALPQNRTLHFARGFGLDRNGSGLVLVVEDGSYSPTRSWILTGDCDYLDFIPIFHPLNPVAVIAPHHGAALDPATPVPSPLAWPYRRLVYSYGYENAHGSKKPPTRHPTTKSVTAHRNAGWNHGAWTLKSPGTPTPNGDVIATCEHAPGTTRGGAVIGWSSAPGPMILNCPYGVCHAPCGQR